MSLISASGGAGSAPLGRGRRQRSGQVRLGPPPPANFGGLVLGCIEAKFCKKICVGKLSPRSTQCTPLHSSAISIANKNRPAQAAAAGFERRVPRVRRRPRPPPSRPRRRRSGVRSEVNSELNFPSNFEGLVLGCIEAKFFKKICVGIRIYLKYALESSRRDLHNALLCTVL